ncbi:MAG: argininosuccinate lyase [Christensenellaceae bacterium]|jgi:argininosuccinate lyase|nr:argininosuccinate lyase [Christensenellaceae bacterium]
MANKSLQSHTKLPQYLWNFNASIGVDKVLWAVDIQGSLAHVEGLAKQNIISQDDCKKISDGLNAIYGEIESGKLEITNDYEDIHSFVEDTLKQRIGEEYALKLHTGRSRNDQIATDFRLYLAKASEKICTRLSNIIGTLKAQAEKYIDVIMPGYTHLQRAQPLYFSHYLMAYCEMFFRDYMRVLHCHESIVLFCPLGSGALAGTSYPLDRNFTAEKLGFNQPCPNSLDGVADRDFAAEFLFSMSLISVHLSRFCEELILWKSFEFDFIEIGDEFTTGSSMMPQKRNPDMAELIRGKSGRVIGNLVSLLTTLKGLPLAYNKDLQEDKHGAFDSFNTINDCLEVFDGMLKTVVPKAENMKTALLNGYVNATACADFLVEKRGVYFRLAYKIVAEIVNFCKKNGNIRLENLPLTDYNKVANDTVSEWVKINKTPVKLASSLFDGEVFEWVSVEGILKRYKTYGSTSQDEIKKQINSYGKF